MQLKIKLININDLILFLIGEFFYKNSQIDLQK